MICYKFKSYISDSTKSDSMTIFQFKILQNSPLRESTKTIISPSGI